MANDTLSLKVVTPNGVALEKEITYANFPGHAGEVGVLPNHSPLLAHIDCGNIEIREDDTASYVFVKSGVAHVRPDSILILAPEIETKEDIDLERAKQAKKRAEDRLASSNKQDVNIERARRALHRAEKRIFVFNN